MNAITDTIAIENKAYISIARASKVLDMCYGTLYMRFYREKLPVKRIGGCILVALDDIEQIKQEGENTHV